MVTPDVFARLVAQCTALVLEGYSLQEVIYASNSPLAEFRAQLDLNLFSECVLQSGLAHESNRYGKQWTRPLYVN
jgi:hypothetical protein